ncbi:MAG: helix-turn-helix transcriptional regulator [Cellvibrionaceae bacterium]
MTTDITRFSHNIELLYEASLNPDRWPYALEALCEDLNAEKVQMLYIDSQDFYFSFACSIGFDPKAHDITSGRFRRYLAEDPVANYGISHLDEIYADSRVIDPEVLRASAMQKEIRDPVDMSQMLTSFMTDGTDDWSGICFFRGRNQPAFSAEDEATLERYAPHIKKATYIHKTIIGSAKLKTIQHAVLDHLDSGILVVDEFHDVVICNKKAEEIMNETKAFKIKNNRIICRNGAENTRLHQSIDEALGQPSSETSFRRIAIKLGGEKNDLSVLAVTTRLQLQALEEKKDNISINRPYYTAKIPSKKSVMITLGSLVDKPNYSTDMLEDLFNLTPAEAALAVCLAEDRSLQEAADILGRKVGTVRVQLQTIFEKTDTNRQASLISLIASIP